MSPLHILVILAVLSSQGFASKICTKPEDCVKDASCENGLCTCAAGKVFSLDGKECLDISLGLGSPCLEAYQCTVLISGPAVCTAEGLCACQDGYKYSGNSCTPVKSLNEDCFGTECFDGIDFFALQCKGEKCICNEGYYLRNGTDCRPSAKTTDECLLDVDCKSGEFCNFEFGPYGKCAKYSFGNTHENILLTADELNYVKAEDNYLDMPCNVKEDCSVPNTFCALFREKCACQESFVYDKNSKQCVKALGEKCSDEENEKCLIRNSFCNKDNLCQCNKYYIYGKYSEKCFKPARSLGNSCGRDQNCYSFGQHAVCKENKCECAFGAYYDAANMLCVSENEGPSKDPCKKCDQIDHSTCVDSNCVCLKDYTYTYSNVTGTDKCLPDIGSQCNERRNDCVIANAKCDINKNCMCDDGFLRNDKRQCVEELDSVTEECNTDAQCKQFYGAGASCSNKKCTCLPEYVLKTEKDVTACWWIKSFGDTCTKKSECETMLHSGHVVCRNSKCSCEYGFEIVEENDQQKCINISSTIAAKSLMFLIFVSLVIKLV